MAADACACCGRAKPLPHRGARLGLAGRVCKGCFARGGPPADRGGGPERAVLDAARSLAAGGRFTSAELRGAGLPVTTAASAVGRLRRKGAWPHRWPLLRRHEEDVAPAPAPTPAAPPDPAPPPFHAPEPEVDPLSRARAFCRAIRRAWHDRDERVRVSGILSRKWEKEDAA